MTLSDHSHYDLESKTERVQDDLWSAEREYRDAIQELTLEVARLTSRVMDLEDANQRRYQADQELSAHLNGTTYP